MRRLGSIHRPCGAFAGGVSHGGAVGGGGGDRHRHAGHRHGGGDDGDRGHAAEFCERR
jgi:hypothetical protein